MNAVVSEIVRPLDWHVEHILESWRDSVNGIIETGRRVQAALDQLPHGEKASLWERLPFGQQTGNRLVRIAADSRITKDAHVRNLPPAWGTLYELTKLDDKQFERGVSKGIIHPGMERKDVKQLLPKPKPRASTITEEQEEEDCDTEEQISERGWLSRAQMASQYARYAPADTCPCTEQMRDAVEDVLAAWGTVLETLKE